MTQPSPYRVNVDPRAKQMDGGGVPYRMGADSFLPQRWGRACGFCDRTFDLSVDTETGYPLAACVEEHRHVLGTFESRTEKSSQYVDRMQPKRAESNLASFSDKAYGSRRVVDMKRSDVGLCCFGGTSRNLSMK